MKETIKEKETFSSKLLKKVSSKLTAKELGYLQDILVEQRKQVSKQYEKKIKELEKKYQEWDNALHQFHIYNCHVVDCLICERTFGRLDVVEEILKDLKELEALLQGKDSLKEVKE